MCNILCGDDLKKIVAEIEKTSINEVTTEAVQFTGLNYFQLFNTEDKKYFFGNVIIQQTAEAENIDETVLITTPIKKKGSTNSSMKIGGGVMKNLGDNITLENVLIDQILCLGQGNGELTFYGIGHYIHFQ